MKKIFKLLVGVVLLLTVDVFADKSHADSQNIQIFSVENQKGSIDAKSIDKAFGASGLSVDVNNDMNSIFSKRYGKVYHKNYNLAIFTNRELVIKLMKKYPTIGLITPLSMSIYEDAKKGTINVATLSLAGMSKVTSIPMDDPDLVAYAKLVDDALHKALPNGSYLPVDHNAKAKIDITEFTTEFELEDGDSYSDAKDSFKEEFESELGPVGFLVPKSYKFDQDDYEFFDTYSIIRFNAIYPVYKNHPDAGAYAPFSLAIYKKKGEDSVHIIFPSIENWITNLDISDKETIKAVKETQEKIKSILEELTE